MEFARQPSIFDSNESLDSANKLDIVKQIEILADKYAKELDKQIKARITEMEQDDRSYYLIYQVLCISK